MYYIMICIIVGGIYVPYHVIMFCVATLFMSMLLPNINEILGNLFMFIGGILVSIGATCIVLALPNN
jgi:hypothetical protein